MSRLAFDLQSRCFRIDKETKPPCPPLKPAHDKVAKGVMLESAFGMLMLVHCLLTKNEVQKFLHGCEAVMH